MSRTEAKHFLKYFDYITILQTFICFHQSLPSFSLRGLLTAFKAMQLNEISLFFWSIKPVEKGLVLKIHLRLFKPLNKRI